MLGLYLQSDPNGPLSIRAIFLKSTLIWAFTVFLTTEILRDQLTFPNVSIFWAMACLTGGCVISLYYFLIRKRLPFRQIVWPHFSLIEKIFLFVISVIVILTGTAAFFGAPNTWDGMVYHLARVIHWQQNHSISFYPTSELFQLYPPPLAEYMVLHFQILNGSDRWADAIQFFSMVGSLMAVSLICSELRIDRRGQLFAVIFLASLPLGILESSHVQNDYVLTLWILLFAYFLLRLLDKPSWHDALWAGLSLGLAFITKGTGYIFGLTLWMAFSASLAFSFRKIGVMKYPLLIISLAMALSVPQNVRCLFIKDITHDIRSYTNSAFGPMEFTSNVIRNSALELATPWPQINIKIEDAVIKGCQYAGIPLEGPAITWPWNRHFQIHNSSRSENTTGNPLHFLILSVSFLGIFLAWKRHPGKLHSYQLGFLAAVLAFLLIVKWHPYICRFHLVLFGLGAPFVSLFWEGRKMQARPYIVFILFLYAAPYLLHSQQHPLLGKHNIFHIPWSEQYFSHKKVSALNSTAAAQFIANKGCQDIGWINKRNSMEYLWWVGFKNTGNTRIRFEHVNVTNFSKDIPYPLGPFSPCAVIVRHIIPPKKSISVNGRTFVGSENFGGIDVYSVFSKT